MREDRFQIMYILMSTRGNPVTGQEKKEIRSYRMCEQTGLLNITSENLCIAFSRGYKKIKTTRVRFVASTEEIEKFSVLLSN